MKGKSLILAIGAIVGVYLFLAAKAVATLNYFIQSVSISFSGIKPVLTINIGIQNVSNESFTIDSFVGTLTVNGTTLGYASSYNPVPITPTSQSIFPVTIDLSLLGLGTDLINAIQGNGGNSQMIVLNGNINASGIVAPVNLTYTIGI